MVHSNITAQIFIPMLPAFLLAALLIWAIGFSDEDKLVSYAIIHTLCYAFCSVKMRKIEMRSKSYKRKIKPKDTSPKDDFYPVLSAFLHFIKDSIKINRK